MSSHLIDVATTEQRLPRFRRVASQVACVLTTRDLNILRLVESFRLLTSEHIQHLAPGSPQGILRRLHKLYHAGLLDRLRPRRVESGGSSKMVYAITNRGIQTLQKEGLIQKRTKTDWSAQNRALGDIHIAHTLLISSIRAVLAATCKEEKGLELLFWREGRELQGTIEVTLPDKYATVPVAPDGFFGLRNAKGRLYFFVEADRGTMTLKRFTRKLQAYAAWRRAEKHTEKFGIKNFRVLIVASSKARCKNLVRAAAAAEDLREDAGIFLFATEQDLPLSSPESVLTKIWSVPGRQEPCSIL